MSIIWKFPFGAVVQQGRKLPSPRTSLSLLRQQSSTRPLHTLAKRPDILPQKPGGYPSITRFCQLYSTASNAKHTGRESSEASGLPSRVTIPIDGENVDFSALLLRDSCSCSSCVHESTKQRLFAAADIPPDVHAREIEVDSPPNTIKIKWANDAPGYGEDHETTLDIADLRNIMHSGQAPGSHKDSLPAQRLWSTEPLNLPDYDYNAYMNDYRTLYQLINQLRTEGLAFVTNVPGRVESLATIATRIGPVKDTFYGHTWDVRTVPEAINAAYTSHDLGFHTDLLYFQCPPHVQLLHCVQSASSGGASVFADAYKAAVDLFHTDIEAFDTLASVPVNYHYNHPNSNVYHTTKPVIDLKPLRIGKTVYTRLQDYMTDLESIGRAGTGPEWKTALLVDCLLKVNWGPPFQAPFSNHEDPIVDGDGSSTVLSALNSKVDLWHRAAVKFNTLLQRPEYLYERKMNPGECVLFDNTRTLHSRRAFNMADVGKPRWLRGTYVDKDPYLSKLRVLQNKFG